MKVFSVSTAGVLGLMILVMSFSEKIQAQGTLPAVLDSARLEEQFEYLQERTRIYNGYRAIREDMFQKIQGNAVDSLAGARQQISELNRELTSAHDQIASLNAELEQVGQERDRAIRNRDSLSFIGIQMNKTLYNTIMWVIVLGLATGAAILFLLFKRSHAVTSSTRNELDTTKEEFDTYRKNAREKYEKLVVSHHNEIMKLKKS